MRYQGGPYLFIPRLVYKVYRTVADGFSTFVYKRACHRFGANSIVQRGVWITKPESVSIGDNVLVTSGSALTTELGEGSLVIGDDCQINSSVRLDYSGGLKIGSNVLVSEETLIYTHDHDLDPRSYPTGLAKIIEDHVWIGARCIVLPSCRCIGTGAVIGAGSVVTHDIPPYCTAAGNPARVLRIHSPQ